MIGLDRVAVLHVPDRREDCLSEGPLKCARVADRRVATSWSFAMTPSAHKLPGPRVPIREKSAGHHCVRTAQIPGPSRLRLDTLRALRDSQVFL